MNGLTLEEQALVARQVAALRQHGWPAGRALRLIADNLRPGEARTGLSAIATALEGGRKPEPQKDPFLALLAQGDAAGPEALRDEVRALELEREARHAWARSIGLPGAMICLAIAMFTVGVAFLARSYRGMFRDFGSRSLPGPTQLLLDLQPYLAWVGVLLLVAVAVGVLLVPRKWAPGVRALRTGALLRRYAAALASGMSESAALSLVDPAATTLLPSAVLSLDRYERALGLAMQQESPAAAATALAGEFEASAKRSRHPLFVLAFEAVAMVVVGGLLGFVLIAMYLPIFSLAGAIK